MPWPCFHAITFHHHFFNAITFHHHFLHAKAAPSWGLHPGGALPWVSLSLAAACYPKQRVLATGFVTDVSKASSQGLPRIVSQVHM